MKKKYELPHCSIGSEGCYLLICGSCYSCFNAHGKILHSPPCYRLFNKDGNLKEPSALCWQGRQGVFRSC